MCNCCAGTCCVCACCPQCCCGEPSFPDQTFPLQGAPLVQRVWESFDQTMLAEYIWICTPADRDALLRVVNWAAAADWSLRAIGAGFSWSPLLVSDLKAKGQKLMLLDLKPHFSAIGAIDVANQTIRVGTGACTLNVLNALDAQGLTMGAYPADGSMTIGGTIAAGTHGAVCTDVPDIGPNVHGCIANSVSSFAAVVYDDASNGYIVRELSSSTDEGRALALSLGRILLLEVTLRVQKQYNVRCISTVTKDLDAVFAMPKDPATDPNPEGTFGQRILSSRDIA